MTTAPTRRVRLSGVLEIALPPEQAFSMFTPGGERTWARDWDPRFPSPGPDEAEPGTVFQILHGGRESTWMVVRCEPGRLIAYATVTPGDRCGLVTVICESWREATRATVNYDLTALTRETDVELDRFAKDYPSFLGHWERSIAEAVHREDS